MRGHRVSGRFSCQNCGLAIDADVNGAWNIAKRAHGLLVHETGDLLAVPRTLAKCEPRSRLERLENPTDSFVGVSNQ